MTTLGYAILGLLAREELSGYDLMGLMKERVGFFWQARHSQIYPELARLEGDGLVTHRLIEQRERPDKKVYRITDSGLATLKEWISKSPVRRVPRDEMVLKAYSLWLIEPDEALTLFREQEHEHEEQLREYEKIETWMENEWTENLRRADSSEFASYAALRRGMIYERGYVEWCRWVAERLEESTG